MHGRLLLAPLAAAALVAAAAGPAAAETITVTDKDSGEVVKVRVGDRIRVELDANETTGYRWVTTRKPDGKVARIVASRYVPEATDGPVVGSGGTQITVVRARHTGATSLRMQYRQVGSGDAGGAYVLRIRVRPAA